MIRTVFGSNKSGPALIPFFDSTKVSFGISTRIGDTVMDWGDGSSSNIAPVKMRDYADGSALSSNFNKSYSSALNGNVSVKFLRGLKDVYSVYLGFIHATNQQSKLNILDVETFFHQFPNLFSLCIEEYAYQTTSRMSVIKGDLAKLPNSVERVLINQAEILNAGTDFTLNFSSYTNFSNLKSFRFQDTVANTVQSTIKVIGDLGKLPTSCQYLYLQKASSGSAITYTAGKTWASSFDTLYLPISLSPAENDNLLNDMTSSITTAIGGKVLYFCNGYRTSASDSAVTYLTGLGFTISGITRLSYTPAKILDLPFQNNFTDYSASGISMVAANGNGLPSFVSDGSGGYLVDFASSKTIKTSTNIALGSNAVSVAFFIKTTQTAVAIISELSADTNTNNDAFGVFLNAVLSNRVDIYDHTTGSNFNAGSSSVNINTGNLIHIAIVVDRGLNANQNKIFVNGILSYTQSGLVNDNNGNYSSYPFFLGGRNGNSLYLVAQMKHYTMWNYPISQSEIITHKNR